jgi:hypothetical protein
MAATIDGARAFDFLHGSWNVANYKLVRRLAGSSDWDEFPGTAVCRGFFDGAANIDQIDFPTLGFTGITLRLFDPAREQWSLYWANSRDGLLQPPVVGRFANGRGDFYGDDTNDGRPIRVHYLWSEITPQSARWQQAFSLDGESWETNWIMQFTRAA